MSKTAVMDTVNALFRFIDARDAVAVAELLTDDAAMADEMSQGWVRGKARIHEFIGTTLAAAEAIYVLSFWVTGQQHLLVRGWASLMFVILIVGAALMIAVGLVGVYVGYIFQEVKRRPVYLVRAVHETPRDRPAGREGPEP